MKNKKHFILFVISCLFCIFAPDFSKFNIYLDNNYEAQTLSETGNYYCPTKTTAADLDW
jgi:hypothetical protein